MIEVNYIDHMGSDLSVVNAARVSFGKKSEWMPRIHYGEDLVLKPKDAKLIKYLAKHQHKSPFNHTFVTFHVKAPVFVARQLVKHEYMPWNEVSRRYVDEEPEFYVPDQWRGRSTDKKQGSEGIWQPDHHQLDRAIGQIKDLYDQMIYDGAAPELARMILPQSMMTEWYWSGTLFSFSKMCGLRLKEDTQAETRRVAEQIDVVMQKIYPVSWDALKEYAQ